MIRTTTTIRGSRIWRGDIETQIRRVGEIVTDAVALNADVAVEFTGAFARNAPHQQDRIVAKVTVTE